MQTIFEGFSEWVFCYYTDRNRSGFKKAGEVNRLRNKSRKEREIAFEVFVRAHRPPRPIKGRPVSFAHRTKKILAFQRLNTNNPARNQIPDWGRVRGTLQGPF